MVDEDGRVDAGLGGGEQPIPTPPWARRPERRRRKLARPPLDREQIVDAALRIVDEHGVAGLSLRYLAEELGVTPMAIYWHVGGKDELLELVGQKVLAEIAVPPPRGDWRDQLRDVHRAMVAGFLRHAETGDLLIGRARYGAGGLALFERILTTLLEAGFSPEASFDAYQSLYLFTLGTMATARRSPEFREAQREGLAYMLGLPEDHFPSIRQVAPTIGRHSFEEQFEIGLDVQLEGIAARLAPARTR